MPGPSRPGRRRPRAGHRAARRRRQQSAEGEHHDRRGDRAPVDPRARPRQDRDGHDQKRDAGKGPDPTGEDRHREQRRHPSRRGSALRAHGEGDSGGRRSDRRALREVAGERREEIGVREQQHRGADAGGARETRQPRGQVEQRSGDPEQEARPQPRRGEGHERRQHRGVTRQVLRRVPRYDEDVRGLEELGQRRRRVAQVTRGQHLRLQQVDVLVFHERHAGRRGEEDHREGRAEHDQEHGAERVEAIGHFRVVPGSRSA